MVRLHWRSLWNIAVAGRRLKRAERCIQNGIVTQEIIISGIKITQDDETNYRAIRDYHIDKLRMGSLLCSST